MEFDPGRKRGRFRAPKPALRMTMHPRKTKKAALARGLLEELSGEHFSPARRERKSSPRCRYCFGGLVVAGFAPVEDVGFTGLAGVVPAAGAATRDCAL